MKNKSTPSSIKWRIVIDTNVFVSAFIFGGKPKSIVQLWLKDKFILILSPFLLTEILLVLKRFGFNSNDLQSLRLILEEHSLHFSPISKAKICRDLKDNAILDLCAASKADFLITGDKDLLVLKQFSITKILEPVQFLKDV